MARRRRKRASKQQAKTKPDIRLLNPGVDQQTETILREHELELSTANVEVDFELGGGENRDAPETPLDYNISREIVPINDNTRIRHGNGHQWTPGHDRHG